MTKENLIFNFKGDKYWEPFFNDESGKLNMYEGHHGNYVGLVMKHTISSFGRNEYDEYESYQAFRADYDLSLTVSVNFSQEIINHNQAACRKINGLMYIIRSSAD